MVLLVTALISIVSEVSYCLPHNKQSPEAIMPIWNDLLESPVVGLGMVPSILDLFM